MTILSTPLSNTEMDQLDDFLLHRINDDDYIADSDEGVINLSELDGFFTAIVSGPTMIPPSQWVLALWGDYEPEWKDETDFENIFILLMRHMNGIAASLMEGSQKFEPLFLENVVDNKTYLIVDEWCEGYMRGVMLTADQWHFDELNMKILLTPIMAFNGEEAMRTHDTYNEQEIINLQNAITPNVCEIHAYWLARRGEAPAHGSSRTPVQHNKPRVGRNEPCPCGSGKKYKKCCLH